MSFQKINNITGWVLFGIAAIVYMLTLEETASYWDCGEFIAVSYKLMVPHPPGAPFFLLLGRMFSFLALGNVESVAYWINMISVLASSFSILFLFWTIVLLGRKVLQVPSLKAITKTQTFLLMGAGVIGALTYTFSDTFWFSAVEAEVYAMSSFFTAFVFWAILKWELIEDESCANRWLILIAYMIGLSIGVHLLNLVTIPALALIYYFKKYPITKWGIVSTMGISGFIVLLINNIIISGLPSLAASFDIFFVNHLDFPFGSGVLACVLLVILSLVYGIIYSIKKQKTLLNTALLSLIFILIGYSSYTLIVIRSNFDPPIDENNPEDIMSFVKYLKREQYGDRPLFHGQYFTAEVVDQKDEEVVYTKEKDKYEITDRNFSYVYDSDQTIPFPRIYSTSPSHKKRYREILGLRKGEVPNIFDNFHFMFKHQLGWMYMRYFMWNFSGRESDIQDADWLSPLAIFKEVPDAIRSNKGRNNYFMIPLILGLIGLFFNYNQDKKTFAIIGLLFFLTGTALILYLNSPPSEPRERDYIYVGSYYAFAIWIGFGVLALYKVATELLGKFASNHLIIGTIVGVAMSAPIIMAIEGWDDHDRSNRYFSVDSAKNFLTSCAPNSIIFTGGDNDTFPLWYVQNVEGFRTDMRVLVLSYSNTDWYIEQMLHKHYGSEPLPFTLTMENYKQGGPNDYLPYYDGLNVKGALDTKRYLELIKNDHEGIRIYQSSNVIPSKILVIEVDKDAVLRSGIIPEGMDSLVVDQMIISLKGSGLEKKDLMILDLIISNNWERPIYFNNTSMSQVNLNLEAHVVQEGNAYRLLPIHNLGDKYLVNTDQMYDNVMNKFQFRGLDDPEVYYNEDYRNFVTNHRSTMNTLAEALIEEGKEDKAKEVLLYSLRKMVNEAIPYDYTSNETMAMLFQLGEVEEALRIAQILGDTSSSLLEYYISNNIQIGYELQRNLIILNDLQRTLKEYGEDTLAQQYDAALERHYTALENFYGGNW